MASSRISVVAPILALASLAGLTTGCQGADLSKVSAQLISTAQAAPAQPAPVQASPVQAAPVQAAPVQAAPAPQPPQAMPMFQMAPSGASGEVTLDTNVRPEPPLAAPGAPAVTTSNLKHSKLRAVSDDQLPKWVPVKGRLTVVDSHDLAENLGLVPKGTTKKTDERISVADKLQEEAATRAAASRTDPMTQGTSWSYAKAGKFRSRR